MRNSCSSIAWDNLSDAVRRRNPHLRVALKDQPTEKRKSKFGNTRVMVDGIWFDSQKEANRYSELRLMQRAGIVKEIELQPRFLLQDGYHCGQTNRWIRKMEYVADFRITYADGRVVVEDVKGFKTAIYRMKAKMFRAKFPDVEFVES